MRLDGPEDLRHLCKVGQVNSCEGLRSQLKFDNFAEELSDNSRFMTRLANEQRVLLEKSAKS